MPTLDPKYLIPFLHIRNTDSTLSPLHLLPISHRQHALPNRCPYPCFPVLDAAVGDSQEAPAQEGADQGIHVQDEVAVQVAQLNGLHCPEAGDT